MMRRKGLVAILDGLLAYTVAFTAIGLVALLSTTAQEANLKTTYTLNVWAEDLADAVGMSLTDGAEDPTRWLDPDSIGDEKEAEIREALTASLGRIEARLGVQIRVEAGADTIYGDRLAGVGESATAKRFLVSSGGSVSVLKVEVGI